MKGNAMNTLAIFFTAYIVLWVWCWRSYLFHVAWSGHNRLAPQSAERLHALPTPDRTDAWPTPATLSQGPLLALLTISALLAGNALAAQSPPTSERSVATTDVTAEIQMPSEHLAGKTASPAKPAPTTPAQLPDPAELPRVDTEPVRSQLPRFSHEPFHNQWVANMPTRN